jgi:OmpA-OmpF porin, OOP family
LIDMRAPNEPSFLFAFAPRRLVCSAALLALLCAGGFAAAAPTAAVTTPGITGKVVVSGVVPDEATRQAILGKAREVYGDRVVDQLGVGNLVAPPNWSQLVQKLITPDLKRVSKGQLKVSGNVVELSGDIQNEAQSQQLASQMSANLNPTYTVRNGLRVAAAGQEVLDAALANRIVEFQPGNAVLTPTGTRTLEELLPVLNQFKGRRFEVIGHTDAQGAAAQNVLLSAERANAVKSFLVGKGLTAASILTSGAGADRPVAGNESAEGRARNRRIEFRVMP